MGLDRKFSVELDKNDHGTKKIRDRADKDAGTIRWADFQKGLADGTIWPTINLQLHVGFFDSVTGKAVSEPNDPLDPLVLKCVVINVGGTVYRICT